MIPLEIAGKYTQPPLIDRVRAWRDTLSPAVTIFLPFAAGYFLSYLFRTINGPLANEIVANFGLGPRDLGALTSVYFLTFAAFQIPTGLLIDQFGPRRVQIGLGLVAAVGAVMFALAQNQAALMIGRALIGLGCSGALVTGFKALSMWLPPHRRAMGNSCFVMCGGLGATASAMPDALGTATPDWRFVFAVLAIATALVACLVWLIVPERAAHREQTLRQACNGLRDVVTDRRFWRIAPLSGSIVGAAFAIHGLWAARWLSDVDGMTATDVGRIMVAMGASLTLGALVFGTLATSLRKRGVPTTTVFVAASLLFIAIETTLATDVPVPPAIVFCAVAVFSAITVVSFTIVGELFPPDLAGRANGALNVMHLGVAFLMQAGIGAIVALWPQGVGGHMPEAAYAAAFTALIALQTVALAWFVISPAKRTTHRPTITLIARSPIAARKGSAQ